MAAFSSGIKAGVPYIFKIRSMVLPHVQGIPKLLQTDPKANMIDFEQNDVVASYPIWFKIYKTLKE